MKRASPHPFQFVSEPIGVCVEIAKKRKFVLKPCPHGKQKYYCKECGGPRAQAWCQKVQTYIDGSSEMIGSCGGSTCLPETFAAQYSTTFTAWVGTLSGTRKTLSDYVAQQITPEEREVSAAESLIERFKRDKKGYDMQVKFYSKNKEPTGA